MTLYKRLLLSMLLLTFITIGTLSVKSYYEHSNELMKGIDEKLRTAAFMARATLPADFHDRITNSSSVSDSEYQAIVDRFNYICKTLNLEYIWSLMDVNGTIVFTTATSPDKEARNRKHAGFFETHSNPELYTKTFTKMKPSYQINDDKWGRIRVVLLPFKDNKGRSYLFGASISLSEVDKHIFEALKLTIIITIFSLFCAFILSIFLAKTISNPITKLTNTIKKISEGNTELVAEEKGSYEQIVLAGSFNHLNHIMQEKIFELNRSKEDLTRQTSLLKGLLLSIPDIIFYKDISGIYLGCNQEFANLVGRSEKEIIGHTDDDLFPKDIADSFKNNDRIIIEQGVSKHNESWINYPDDRRILVDTLGAPLQNISGEIIGILGVSRNITERKQIENELKNYATKLEQSNKELAEFSYIASHDLKEPLRGISNYASFIKMDHPNLEETVTNKINHIIELTEKLDIFINELLAFSKIGNTDLIFNNYQIKAIVEESIDNIQSCGFINNSEIIINDFAETTITCNKERLKYVYQNLITNGLKYNTNKHKRIEIGSFFENNQTVYYVYDNGIGIEEKHHEIIFQIFKRLHPKEEFSGGTGVGLAIVKKVILQHNGNIWLKSAPNQGTTFYFTLNIKKDYHDKI